MITLGQLQHISKSDPKLYEVLKQLVNSQNMLNNLHGLDTSGKVTPPPPVGGLTVVQNAGVFRITIIDKSPISKGITYFLEHDTSASFSQPVTISLGPARDWQGFLGSDTFYFRAYSQYPLSGPSPKVYWGTPTSPTGVAGGGAIAGPAPLAEQGSGTSNLPGRGYGDSVAQPPATFTGFPRADQPLL